MKNIQGIRLAGESGEELLPGFSLDFPYIATRPELYKYSSPDVPWHWHRTVELFYMESGTLEYRTPRGKWVFPAGSGGFVNSNILHASRIVPSGEAAVQMIHLFEPELISGVPGSRIDLKYVRPLTGADRIELLPLYPENPEQASLLRKICAAFDLQEDGWGYELILRQKLTEIWLDLLEQAKPLMTEGTADRSTDDKVKTMLLYIHAHYPEDLSVDQLAAEAHVSRRVCFRLFRDRLHTSPLEYLTGYRLRRACQLLEETDEPITAIACRCGFSSASYFGRCFREAFDCTPAQHRRNWHDRENNPHE